MTVRAYVRPYANTLKTKSTIITIATSSILGVYAIVNWPLSQQAIRWPVSRDYIAGSGLELTAHNLLVYQ